MTALFVFSRMIFLHANSVIFNKIKEINVTKCIKILKIVLILDQYQFIVFLIETFINCLNFLFFFFCQNYVY